MTIARRNLHHFLFATVTLVVVGTIGLMALPDDHLYRSFRRIEVGMTWQEACAEMPRNSEFYLEYMADLRCAHVHWRHGSNDYRLILTVETHSTPMIISGKSMRTMPTWVTRMLR